MFKKLISKLYNFNIIVYITGIISSVFSKINKPISISYSFNILAVISWITFLIVLITSFSLKSGDISGIVIIYILAIYYAVTFLIFIITYIIEHIFSLEIKNKFITQNKFIAILRYIGLLIWLVPLLFFLNAFM